MHQELLGMHRHVGGTPKEGCGLGNAASQPEGPACILGIAMQRDLPPDEILLDAFPLHAGLGR